MAGRSRSRGHLVIERSRNADYAPGEEFVLRNEKMKEFVFAKRDKRFTNNQRFV